MNTRRSIQESMYDRLIKGLYNNPDEVVTYKNFIQIVLDLERLQEENCSLRQAIYNVQEVLFKLQKEIINCVSVEAQKIYTKT